MSRRIPYAAAPCLEMSLTVQLLIVCVCFSLILFGFIWLTRKREAAMQQTIGTQKNDLQLALRGTGEAIWTWRLDTQEITQVGFEPLVEGQFRQRDIVEHRRHETHAERRLPGRLRQSFNRHHGRGDDE